MVAQSALCHSLLQLSPRASAWGREKQNSFLDPRKEGRRRHRLKILGVGVWWE